jgi:glycosyltransferase involved in cell wall biosynthesis
MKVHVVDPSAYSPPYDHALCAALAAEGLDVELFTSAFRYGEVPAAEGYRRREVFYRLARGSAGSPLRRAIKIAEHVPDMLRYAALARAADIVHFQWLVLSQIDGPLLPRGRPLVLTAHDILPRERAAGSRTAHHRLLHRFDAVIAHSLDGRRRLIDELGLDPSKVHTIPHGALSHLAAGPPGALPPELGQPTGPVVLYFGLIRPYKGLDVLIDAWNSIRDAELWIVGRPRFDISALRTDDSTVRWVPRFVSDSELAACFARADIVVLPYREIEQSSVLATALAFGRPLILSDVGGFGEVADAGAAKLVPPGDPRALHAALTELLADPAQRTRLASAAKALADGDWSWKRVAERTKALYETLLS